MYKPDLISNILQFSVLYIHGLRKTFALSDLNLTQFFLNTPLSSKVKDFETDLLIQPH